MGDTQPTKTPRGSIRTTSVISNTTGRNLFSTATIIWTTNRTGKAQLLKRRTEVYQIANTVQCSAYWRE